MDQLDLFHIKGGAVTARLIQGQAWISIHAVATVSCGCNGAICVHVLLCTGCDAHSDCAEQVVVVFNLL